MSEEDRDIDVESDDVPDVGVEATATTSNSAMDFEEGSLDKRAHHNALERRRRDHIKDSFHGLRDTIPSLHGEKVSRAHILNKATEYIRQLQKGGSVREGEIHDLQKKNEILEEQVQAMEQAKSLGNVENAEEILQMVVERVQARQRQHSQHQLQMKLVANQHSRKEKPSDGNKDNSHHPDHAPLTSKPPTIAGSTDNRPGKEGMNPILPNSINLLASNLKSAQSLLSALQKNLPANANLPANVKSLAARVLASPLRQQGNSTAHPQALPRGIVTATTVPKGSPLPTTLTSALQQPPRSQGTPPTGKTSPLPAAQLMPTATPTTPVPAVGTPKSVDVAPTTGSKTETPQATATSAPQLSPSLLSQTSPSLLSQASSLSSQLLAANSLLQQGSAARGGPGGIPAGPQLTPELIAQVSSFLNLPAPGAPKAASSAEAKMASVEARMTSSADAKTASVAKIASKEAKAASTEANVASVSEIASIEAGAASSTEAKIAPMEVKTASTEKFKAAMAIPSVTSTVVTTASTVSVSSESSEVVGTHAASVVSPAVAAALSGVVAGGQGSEGRGQDGNTIFSAADNPTGASVLKRGPLATTLDPAVKKARIEL